MAGMSGSGKQKFEIACASRGFHVYREIWNPKTGQKLQVNQEINNIHDPFAISLGAKLNGKLTSNEIVGHIPREISRFCHFFINYGGKLEAHVTCAKYRPSPIPSGGLEIPILLSVKKGDATEKVFSEMETFIKSYYIEPDRIVVSTNNENYNEEIDLDVEFVPDSEIEESQPTAENHEHDGNDDSMEVIPETQTQVIPETQGISNTQTVPETQTTKLFYMQNMLGYSLLSALS